MRNLLLAIFLLFPVGLRAQVDSLSVQEARLNKTLNKVEKQFGLEDTGIVLQVKPADQLSAKGVWSLSFADDSGAHIEILALQSYPPSMPLRRARAFQKEVVQHEAMHFVLMRLGVPHDAQDRLIHGLQGAMRKP